MSTTLSPSPSWPEASRLPLLNSTGTATSTGILLACGAAAALATTLIDLQLRMPGHAILKATLPYLIGMALVPRRGAGTVMSAGSLITLVLMGYLGVREGMGSATSLVLLGPCLDFAVAQAKPNVWLYLRFAVAGLIANLCAFLVQMTAKRMGFSLGGGRDLQSWLSLALITYPAFGFAAGLLCAAVLFHWRPRHTSRP